MSKVFLSKTLDIKPQSQKLKNFCRVWYTPLKKFKQWRRDQKVYFQYVSQKVTIIKGSKEKQPEMDK